MMWSNKFKIFGDGTDKLILIDGDVGYVIHSAFLSELRQICESIEIPGYIGCGDGYKRLIPGTMSSEIAFKGGRVEIVSGKDLADLYDPVMQKSVTELMKAVNKKLRDRA